VPRRDPVQRVHVVGDVEIPIRQLLAKSYRPGTRRPQRPCQVRKPLDERFRADDQRLPEPLAPRRVERREDLAPPRVQHGEVVALPPLGHRAPECIEGADTGGGDARAHRQAPGSRQPDPDPDERARSASDGNQAHPAPTARSSRRALDLGEQGGRVTRAPVGRQAERRLVQHLAVAHRADSGVGSSRVEPDDRLFVDAELSQ